MSEAIKTWERFKKYLYQNENLGFNLDISKIPFPDQFFESQKPIIKQALSEMKKLEQGEIANIDEKRMVGHYWLRNEALAPAAQIKEDITAALKQIKDFTAKVHNQTLKAENGSAFKHIVLVGIGGSALGPEFIARSLAMPTQKMDIYFMDNTDPDGMDLVFNALEHKLAETLAIVISKSGGTKETYNGMVELKNFYRKKGLNFNQHAVAVTKAGSKLDGIAQKEQWLATFPMWDWVGGRTSVMSAVGLLPAALQGIDIDQLLGGAREMDQATRSQEVLQNPALLLALMWYYETRGKGEKDMVIIPYKDRLVLFSKYLQQLIMESLGKEFDLKGKSVHQGIAVYGNKGSTDQHAYIQQLRDGINNFFVIFIEILKSRPTTSLEVEPGVTAGDYLFGFLMGTRQALAEKNRNSITITLKEISARTIGCLIALFERAVGYYAFFVDINAYHQPGVEAGKIAAQKIIDLKLKIVAALKESQQKLTLDEISSQAGINDKEAVYKILTYLTANADSKVKICDRAGFDSTYQYNG